MRVAMRIAFAAALAALVYGFYEAKLLAQWIWTPLGLNRLIGVVLAYTAISALLVWSRPRLRIPVIDWFDVPLSAALLATGFGLAAHVPINYPWFWGFAAAGAVAFVFRRRQATTITLQTTEYIALSIAGLPLLLHLLPTISPESSGDGLAMHLVIPEWIAAHHQWSFDAARLAWAVMPMNGDWLASIAFLTGGEYAAKFLNSVWLLTICAGLYRVLRGTLAREWALVGVALFASTPIVMLVTGSLFVENIWTLFLFAGFLALREDRVYTAAIVLGAAMGTKFGSLAMILVLLPFALWGLRNSPRKLAGFLGLLCAFACIPYVTAYIVTGSPLFPFFNGTFHSALYEDRSILDSRFPRGVTWRLLYDATIYSSRYLESQNGVAGFQWLLFLPVVALGWKSLPALGRAALAAGVAFVILEFQGLTYLRYAYPAFVLLSIPIAIVVRENRWFAAAAGLAFAANIYFLGGSGFQHRDLFLNLFDAKEREHFSEFYIPRRKLISELNRIAPGEPAAMLAGNQIAGMHTHIYSATWHSWKFENELRNATAPEDILKLIERFSIRYIVAPTEASAVQMASVQARDMLNLCTATHMEYGGFRLSKVLATCKADSRPAAKAGTYDDKDLRILYRGAWIRDTQFPETFGHTITYSATAGESALLAFEGSKLTWVFTKAANRGIAQVLIDGVEQATVDLYAPTTEWQARRSFEVPAGFHQFELRVTGRKNKASTDTYVDADALIVK